jgi:hypothetical protein
MQLALLPDDECVQDFDSVGKVAASLPAAIDAAEPEQVRRLRR